MRDQCSDLRDRLYEIERIEELDPSVPDDRLLEFDPKYWVELDPEDRLVELDPEDRLVELDPEDRLVELDPEDRLIELDPEDRLAEIDPEDGLAELDPECRFDRFIEELKD